VSGLCDNCAVMGTQVRQLVSQWRNRAKGLNENTDWAEAACYEDAANELEAVLQRRQLHECNSESFNGALCKCGHLIGSCHVGGDGCLHCSCAADHLEAPLDSHASSA